MDQNTKRDRDQKMKRDKRSKDAKRSHTGSSKSEGKSTNTLVSKSQSTSMKTQESTPPLKPALPSDTEKDIDETPNFDNLKRETDAIAEINKSFSKRQITSNWSRYETPLPSGDDDIISRGADFESLLSAPISEGGHFKFKSEKMWSSNPSEYSTIFSLDLKQLARGLSCIPFYKQVDIPTECFSVDELEHMENEAKQSSERFKSSSSDSPNNFLDLLKSSLVGKEIRPEETSDLSNYPKPENVQEFSKVENLKVSSINVIDCDETATLPIGKEKVTNHSPSTDGDSYAIKLLPEPVSSNKINNNSTSLSSIEVRQPSDKQLTNPQNTVLNAKDQPVSSSTEDDELDFLLTLKEPIKSNPPKYIGKFPSQPQCLPIETGVQSVDSGAVGLSLPHKEETVDLEIWLDSILD